MGAGSGPLDQIVQIGIVVEDIDQAVQAWSRLLGMEPSSIIVTDPEEIAHTRYEDQPTPARAKLAFFDLGRIVLELIQPLGKPSTWSDHLSAHGPGLHHVAFEVQGMEECIRELGLRVIQRGEYTGGRYAYLDGQRPLGAVIELLEKE